jgi:anti-sigma regulatory factor (Ser/Thr protein kinase)
VTRPVRVRLVLPRTPRAELLATRAVEQAGQHIAFPRDTLAEVKLAVVEACLNALEYGSGEVEVEDHGPGFDPTGVARPVLEDKLRSDRKRGWGLELIRRLMDEVEITSQPGLTTVRMIRRRGGE